jgi:AraC-like DNA-binding protein
MEIEKLRCQADNTSGPTHSVLECDTSEHSPEMSAFLLNVITIVNESLPTGHYSVEDIASKLNISVQTFRRRIQTEVGQTPKAFITAIQMELADKLLTQSTEMSIQDVARQCGFDETSTFSHTFRRTYGVSPSKYRKQNMGQPPKQVIL